MNEMMNAEYGMMNESTLPLIHHSSLRIHHSAFVFILPILSIL